MKGTSERRFRELLTDVDLPGLIIYKPPDDARNWKPCDFMVWTPAPFWFECKDTDAVNIFNLGRKLRPSQLTGIQEAVRLGIPYWIAVFWRKHHHWTISDVGLLRMRGEDWLAPVRRELLMSRYGVDSTPANLPSTLKTILLGEV